MVDFKTAIFSIFLLGIASSEARSRQKRQAWRNVPTFQLSDGVLVKQSPPAKKDPPPPPPPPAPKHPAVAADPWGTGNNWAAGMGTGSGAMGSGGSGGNTAQWHPPPPPPQQIRQQNHGNHLPPPPPPQNLWNHHPPPPPPNHWSHPPPPQNFWQPPPPPPQQNNAVTSGGSGGSGGSAIAGAIALAKLQQQMQMTMLTAGMDTPDNKRFNPAPVEILQYTCPPELPIKQCLINPCPLRCKRYPLAKCYTNPCGNCGPEWIQNSMKIIDCD